MITGVTRSISTFDVCFFSIIIIQSYFEGLWEIEEESELNIPPAFPGCHIYIYITCCVVLDRTTCGFGVWH